MHLIIVESPVKSKTLQRFLGPKYKVLSSYGHIRDLPKSELGIDVEQDFKPKYIIPTKVKKNVNSLKKEAQKAESVILAVDEDREGEAIAWHLIQALQLGKFQIPNNKFQTPNDKPTRQANSKSQIPNSKPYARIVFHEITKSAIQKAIENPRKINMDLVNAQQARRVLDRLVGYKLSPFLWKKVARGLSAGRVQSVAVRLIVEREREIEKFVPQEYWTITASLRKQTQNNNAKLKTEFESLLIKKDGKTIPKLGIKSEKEAEKIVKDLKGVECKVINIEKKEIKRNPLPPFTTSTLQQTAGKQLYFSSQKTMFLAQRLYEKGLISYHRTDSLNLSQESLSSAKKFIVKNFGKDYWPGFSRKYKTKSKGAQEAHEAIRPTNIQKTPETIKMERTQLKLYKLIWQRFTASQMSEAIFDATDVKIKAGNYIFRTNGQTLKFDGFLKVYPVKFKEAALPPLVKEEILDLLKLTSSQHFTKPPARYNEPTLIKTLEEHGIGRPSTYVPIIFTIQRRNYVQKNEQKRFQPTEIGIVVNDILVEHFPKIVEINFTAKMESDLDQIARGKEEWSKVVKDFYGPFEKNLKQKQGELSKQKIAEEKTDKICPKCGSPLIIKLGRFGKFFACTGFPKCKFTESLEDNKLNIKCPKCEKGGIVEKRTRKGKIFYGCNKYPECDFAVWDKPTNETCPKCGWPLVKTKKNQTKCSNKECQEE